MSEKPAINPSLIRKSNARLAAVQSFYQHAGADAPLNPDAQTAWMKQLLSGDKEARKSICAQGLEPHYPTLTKLLSGVQETLPGIDALIDSLQPRRERERMSQLLLAILRCGIYELRFSAALKPPAVIAEYTSLAGHFFGEAEVAFVHAMLQKLSVDVIPAKAGTHDE